MQNLFNKKSINNSRMRGFVVYTWLFSGVIGLEWTTGTIPNNTTLYECEGHNVSLFWNFSAGVGERVESIKWYFKPSSQGETLLATMTGGYFVSTGRENQRLLHDENARLTISRLKSSDFGTYIVRVFVRKNVTATVHSRVATIALPVPPVIANDKLTVRLLPEAVRQDSTGRWHVQLACGSFVDIGKPESDVVWETPWSKEIQSTRHEKDIFILTIPNPVQTGNYTCKLRVSNNTERCGGLSARVQRKAVFELQSTDARLLILDAQSQAFQKEIQNLKAEITVLNQTVSASKDKLSALEGRVGSEITVLNQTVSASKDKLSALEGRVGCQTGFVRTEHEELPSSGNDRYTSKRITFNKRFVETPIVSASFRHLDANKDANLRVNAGITSVDSSGFTLIIGEWADTYIYSFTISWIACSSY